ncbi:MAG: hypothetical protein ABJG68_05340 [Crocinitomicaceae bacterium]
MKNIIYLLITYLLISCGNAKPAQQEDIVSESTEITRPKKFNTKIFITHSTPYCGGMAPTPDMLANLTQPQSNQEFVLIDLTNDTKKNVKTDATGTLYLNLKKGKYAIREKYKDCSFTEFKNNNLAVNKPYCEPSLDTNCMYNWWMSNLGEFEVSSLDSLQEINYGTSNRCFTGNNPCIYYNGPIPP